MRLIWLAMLLSSCQGSAGDSAGGITAKAHALDGDTVAVDYRLYGADAFEKRQLCRRVDGCWPCGKAAQDFTSNLLKRSDATIRTVGKSSYGHLVATVDIDGRDLGEMLIAQGLAIPRPGYLRSDAARATRYEAAFEKARANHVGAHDGSYIDPTDWRRGRRLSCEQ